MGARLTASAIECSRLESMDRSRDRLIKWSCQWAAVDFDRSIDGGGGSVVRRAAVAAVADAPVTDDEAVHPMQDTD